MSILHAISESTTDEVEAAGLIWRVRRINSADLAKVGFAALAISTPDMGKDGEEIDPAEFMNRVTPKQAADLANLQEATVAAGCSAVGDGEGSWDELKLVLDSSRHDPDKGVLWVGSLPPGVVEVLFTRIMSLSTDQEEAAKRLASFRGKPATSKRDRNTRKKVSKVAARGT